MHRRSKKRTYFVVVLGCILTLSVWSPVSQARCSSHRLLALCRTSASGAREAALILYSGLISAFLHFICHISWRLGNCFFHLYLLPLHHLHHLILHLPTHLVHLTSGEHGQVLSVVQPAPAPWGFKESFHSFAPDSEGCGGAEGGAALLGEVTAGGSPGVG